MDCPHCHSSTQPQVHGGVEVETCSACGGLWLDVSAIHRVIRERTGEVPDELFTEPNLSSTLACPRCEGAPPLMEVGFLGVDEIDLDICKGCHGLFIPDEEAQAIARLLKWLEDEEPADPNPALPALQLIRTIAGTLEKDGERTSWDHA